MEVQGKRSQENGPKAEKDKSDRTRQKKKRGYIYIEKWDQTDGPEIPDRGQTSEMVSCVC